MASTAVAQREERPASPMVLLRHELEQRASEFRMALPAHISPEKFQRTILTAVQSNAKLLQADRRSFLTSCMKAAQDGLLPDGREAALVEFKTRQKDGTGQFVDVRLVQYMPMAYGIRKKILQSGEVKDIFAAVVYRQEIEAGLFVYEEGTERQLRHKPLLDPEFDPKDEDIAVAYSIATLGDGTKVFEVMRRSEINKVRQVSQTGAVGRVIQYGPKKGTPIEPKGPWVDWFSEMAKKSVMRRHSKTLPMSGDIMDVEAMDDLAAARSTQSLLGAVDESPAQLSAPRRSETGADDFAGYVEEEEHDPATGEIIEGKAEEAKPKPKRERKAKPEDARQDTVTDENPAAAEGPADEQRGEAHNDDGERGAQPKTILDEIDRNDEIRDRLIGEARGKEILADITKWERETQADYDSLPDSHQALVDEAIAGQRSKLEARK
jgi:recombination protein RecT